MYKFFAYLSRMKNIKRWSLMRSIKEENIMEHSHQVAVIAHALATISNKMFGDTLNITNIVLYAQYHEVGEVITGDLPTPIKYFNPEIKNAYKDLEKQATERILGMLPNELKEEYDKYLFPDIDSKEYKFVKYADRLSAYIKCIEELKAGNLEFKKAKTTIGAKLKKITEPAVVYYLKEFIPTFELTLDELD